MLFGQHFGLLLGEAIFCQVFDEFMGVKVYGLRGFHNGEDFAESLAEGKEKREKKLFSGMPGKGWQSWLLVEDFRIGRRR